MLKVLFITAAKDSSGRTNVGDRVILAGARNLIAGAFGAYAYREIGRWNKVEQDPEEFDLIVYAGMPQYGSRRSPTDVELRFDALLNASRKATVINIGGGTPSALDLDVEATAERMAHSGIGEFYRTQTKLAFRTTRDLVGKRFFDKIGVACELRPCPSFFSTLHLQPALKQRDAIAFISDDTFVTARVKGSMSEHLKRLMGRLPGYELTSHSRGDLAMLGQFGEPHVYFRTELDAIDYYATVGNLASLRIHAGVPAWTLGANVVVGAFDGRIHMFNDTGMPIPWIDMVTHDFEKLADALADSTLHLPFERRKALIDAAYLSFVERLRVACPTLVERASTSATPVAGLALYPEEGFVTPHPSGRAFLPPRPERLPRFVSEDEVGERGIVRIPRGAVAEHGHVEPFSLPINFPGEKFQADHGKAEGGQLLVPLNVKKGVLARGPQFRLPFGRYKANVSITITASEGIDAAFKLALLAKTNHCSYGETVTAVKKSKSDNSIPLTLVLEFENSYPSANVIFEVILRQSLVNATLSIDEMKIEGI
jgi:hypothetical protein